MVHLHHKYCKANSIAMRLKYLSFSFSVPRQLQAYTSAFVNDSNFKDTSIIPCDIQLNQNSYTNNYFINLFKINNINK